MRASGIMGSSKAKASSTCLMALCMRACGKRDCLQGLASANTLMAAAMTETGSRGNLMAWARKLSLKELLLMDSGSKVKHEAMGLKYSWVVRCLKENGTKVNSCAENASSQMVRSMMENGMKGNRKGLVLKFGPMEKDTRGIGFRVNRLVKVSKLIRTELSRKADGKVEYSYQLAKKKLSTHRNLRCLIFLEPKNSK